MLDNYLFFDGQCAEAMKFYERVTGGTLKMMMKYSESPEGQCPAGSENRIMHSSIMVGDRNLMASDSPVGEHKPMQGFSLSLFYESPEEAKQKFDMLAEGGTVTMPIGPTFWAKAFGMLTDRFGTSWMVSGGEVKPS
ncbi:3-demethylubiquinone-9 3-methyltransferase [Ramlibacter tataouinensis]|uniref:3-demethylubiquinone-9 3-methyltransferase n=2 Tax=Ramlibacter tataouinensis TaxID=94132 RepID=A0A127JQ03_9BURK|nr:3-demethylubiquinone-9 3-methyltransferase [Ramlibacter tataouinensis]